MPRFFIPSSVRLSPREPLLALPFHHLLANPCPLSPQFTKRGSIFLCINLALPQALKDEPPHAAGVRRRSFQKPPVQWLERTPSQVLTGDLEAVGSDYPMLSLRPESRLNSAPAITTYKEVGRRALEVAEQTGRVRLVVSCEDTGVGIAPHVQPRLFKPFLQVGAPTGRKWRGIHVCNLEGPPA